MLKEILLGGLRVVNGKYRMFRAVCANKLHFGFIRTWLKVRGEKESVKFLLGLLEVHRTCASFT